MGNNVSHQQRADLLSAGRAMLETRCSPTFLVSLLSNRGEREKEELTASPIKYFSSSSSSSSFSACEFPSISPSLRVDEGDRHRHKQHNYNNEEIESNDILIFSPITSAPSKSARTPAGAREREQLNAHDNNDDEHVGHLSLLRLPKSAAAVFFLFSFSFFYAPTTTTTFATLPDFFTIPSSHQQKSASSSEEDYYSSLLLRPELLILTTVFAVCWKRLFIGGGAHVHDDGEGEEEGKNRATEKKNNNAKRDNHHSDSNRNISTNNSSNNNSSSSCYNCSSNLSSTDTTAALLRDNDANDDFPNEGDANRTNKSGDAPTTNQREQRGGGVQAGEPREHEISEHGCHVVDKSDTRIDNSNFTGQGQRRNAMSMKKKEKTKRRTKLFVAIEKRDPTLLSQLLNLFEGDASYFYFFSSTSSTYSLCSPLIIKDNTCIIAGGSFFTGAPRLQVGGHSSSGWRTSRCDSPPPTTTTAFLPRFLYVGVDRSLWSTYQNGGNGRKRDTGVTPLHEVAHSGEGSRYARTSDADAIRSPALWKRKSRRNASVNNEATTTMMQQLQGFPATTDTVSPTDVPSSFPSSSPPTPTPPFLSVSAEMAFMLLEHGADVNAQTTDGGDTPLHLCWRFDSDDIAQLLLDHGADSEALNDRNQTPLDMAMINAIVVAVTSSSTCRMPPLTLPSSPPNSSTTTRTSMAPTSGDTRHRDDQQHDLFEEQPEQQQQPFVAISSPAAEGVDPFSHSFLEPTAATATIATAAAEEVETVTTFTASSTTKDNESTISSTTTTTPNTVCTPPFHSVLGVFPTPFVFSFSSSSSSDTSSSTPSCVSRGGDRDRSHSCIHHDFYDPSSPRHTMEILGDRPRLERLLKTD